MITPSWPGVRLTVDDPSRAGEVRRMAAAIAARAGFDETGRGRVALVATEAATNLAKHARDGEILLQALTCGASGGLDIVSVDRGPGMADVARCLADGYSTAGSPGTGLGAMRRLACEFDLHSEPGVGTASIARLWNGPRPAPGAGPRFGAVNLPIAGEEVSGDSWACVRQEGRDLVLVVDGLGHGEAAAEASGVAVGLFLSCRWPGPVEAIQAMHEALKATRGAAMAVAEIDPRRARVLYAGVGNIAASILGLGEFPDANLVSHNGTVGHVVRKVQAFEYPWSRGATLVMASDGLGSRWHVDRYPGLLRHHPGLLAGILYRDFQRGRDDVTVVVAREDGAGQP